MTDHRRIDLLRYDLGTEENSAPRVRETFPAARPYRKKCLALPRLVVKRGSGCCPEAVKANCRVEVSREQQLPGAQPTESD